MMPLRDRQRFYERYSTDYRFLPGLPVVVRLDGRSFHSFTRSLKRPFDDRFREVMVHVTKCLVEETGAIIGYTQSDEITLVLYKSDPKSQIYFNGYRQKIESVLSAKASVVFVLKAQEYWPDLVRNSAPVFDCRAFMVPSREEAINNLLYRVRDSVRNSIMQLSLSRYSHEDLQGIDSKKKQEMLWKAGVNWNDLPMLYKEGMFVAYRELAFQVSPERLASIPEAYRPSTMWYYRRKILELNLPKFASIKNQVGVVFLGEDPITDPSFDEENFILHLDDEYAKDPKEVGDPSGD